MALLVLEGPDGSGKTTLAQKLLRSTGRPTLLVKRSGPPGDIETLNFMSGWLKQQSGYGLNVIADRHPIISECIYRPVVRREGAAPWTVVEAAAALRIPGLLIIYCRPDDPDLHRSAKVEEQMEGVHDYYWDLVKAYDNWFKRFGDYGINVHKYNYAEDPHAALATQLVVEFWDHTRRYGRQAH